MLSVNAPMTAIRMARLPAPWRRILSILTLHFPNATLAGGAMRDMALGRVAKDLDIFVNPAINDEEFMRISFRAEKISREEITNYPAAHEIADVYRFEYHTWPVELIICTDPVFTTPMEIIETFDIGLCQIGIDAAGRVSYTQAFYDDMVNNTLTAVSAKTPISTRMRLDRFRGYFPDREFRGLELLAEPERRRIEEELSARPKFDDWLMQELKEV